MTNEELTKKLDYFDSVVALENSKVNGVNPNTPEWQTACAERYKTLLTLSSEVKDFFVRNGKIKNLPNGKALYGMLFSSAATITGGCGSYHDMYDWYKTYEEMVISFVELANGVKEKPVVHLQGHSNLSDDEIERFKHRLRDGEKYDAVIQDFYSLLSAHGKLEEIPWHKELCDCISHWVTETASDATDLRELERLYGTYESMALYAMNVVGVIELHQNDDSEIDSGN